MKRILIASACLLVSFSTFSQLSVAWLKGQSRVRSYGVYGTKGIADPQNSPGNRGAQATWKDKNGDIWIFGGSGLSRNGGNYLSDLWKYSPKTDLWTWMGGSQLANQKGNYGTKGVASPENLPRARTNAATWIDDDGNFWLYGGRGYDVISNFEPIIILNDLWKYSPATGLWTWMGGNNTYPATSALSHLPVFGQRNVAAEKNYPGSRAQAAFWKDKNGDFWVFGGFNYNTSFHESNDLWRYSVTSGLWTFVSGDTTYNPQGVYGIKGEPGAANKPPGRFYAEGWSDSQNDFWIFGGTSSFNTPARSFNDLWRFSIATGQWTWMKGDSANPSAKYQGTGSDLTPGAGAPFASWQDENDNFWIYGRSYSNNERYNDVWRYDRLMNNWEWISGDSVPVAVTAIYGEKNVYRPENRPGSNLDPSVWLDADRQLNLRTQNQIWKYQSSLRQWAWISGDSTVNLELPTTEYSIVGNKGISSPDNLPISRSFGATWRDKSGFLWMFGGSTSASPGGLLSDLWKYDPVKNEWAWMGGDTMRNSPGIPGTPGVPSITAIPSARQYAATWTDKAGNFWLFGGLSSGSSPKSELWKFNPLTLEWTLVRTDGNTDFGVLGVEAPTNAPGGRYDAACWTDTAGNLLLAGGRTSEVSFRLNEVWRFNPASGMWTWLSGNKNPQINGEGLVGVAAWTDASGKLWSFGGNGFAGSNFYNSNGISGSFSTPAFAASFFNQNDRGLYGTKGVEGSNTRPPARRSAIGWSDAQGNQYIFGGKFDTTTFIFYPQQYFNDIWKYNPATSRWSWIGGDTIRNQSGDYGALGVPSMANKAGARLGSQSWSDPATGRLWIFSGTGYPETGVTQLRDMLLITTGEAALPVRFGSFNALQKGETVALSWTTLQEQHAAAFIIERSRDGLSYSSIGAVAASGNRTSVSSYSFVDYAPVTGSNYYRLKQVDADNHFMYSEVRLVRITAGNNVSVLQNPVYGQLRLQLQLGSAEKLTMLLKSTTGQQVMSRNINATTGHSTITVDVTGIRSGLYYLHVKGKTINQTISILKN